MLIFCISEFVICFKDLQIWVPSILMFCEGTWLSNNRRKGPTHGIRGSWEPFVENIMLA